MTAEDADDGLVTEADLREARERWADPKHTPLGTELFAEAVVGDGFRGDVPIGAKEAGDGKIPIARDI